MTCICASVGRGAPSCSSPFPPDNLPPFSCQGLPPGFADIFGRLAVTNRTLRVTNPFAVAYLVFVLYCPRLKILTGANRQQ